VGGGVRRGREEDWRGEGSTLAGEVNSEGLRSLGEPEPRKKGRGEREREREGENKQRKYRMAGNFRGVQFSWMGSLQCFLFADARNHAHYTLYNRTYFAGLIFVDSRSSAKTMKIGPHENFPLYGRY
jgi:hypothetical protein